MANKRPKKKKTAGDIVLSLILVAAICVFCYAAFNLFHIYTEYKKGTDEYNNLVQMAVTEKEPDAEMKPSEEQTLKPPMDIDFHTLQSVNPGNYNFAGTIFIDYENSSDFSDCNTLVYGHNMKNGSMFGQLKKFTENEETFNKSKYFWIFVPGKAYRYEIISAYTTSVNSDTYTLFKGPGEEYLQYLSTIKGYSELKQETADTNIKDKIITLSTCTGNEATRYVVQGKRVDTIETE